MAKMIVGIIPSQPGADLFEHLWRVALTNEGVISDSLNNDVVQLLLLLLLLLLTEQTAQLICSGKKAITK